MKLKQRTIDLKKSLSFVLAALMLIMIFPSGFNLSAFASSAVSITTSATGCSDHYDNGVPTVKTTFTVPDDTYVHVNFQTGSNIYCTDCTIYIYKDGSLEKTWHWLDTYAGVYNWFQWLDYPIRIYSSSTGSYQAVIDYTYYYGGSPSQTYTGTTVWYPFEVIQWCTVTYKAGSNGSIGTPTTKTIKKGTSYSSSWEPSVYPDAGYKFSYWSNVPSTVTSNVTITARFAYDATQWATVYYRAGENGTIGTPTSKTVLKGTSYSSSWEPTARGNTGYRFTGWSGAPSTVNNNVYVTAQFEHGDLHIWNDGVQTGTATCKVEGEKTFTCTICNETKTEKTGLDPNNHADYGTHLINTSEPKCTENGYSGDAVCNGCGMTLESGTAIDATGHAYALSGWTWTETTTGYAATAHFVCENNPTHTKDVEATVTPATTAPGCENGGQVVYTANLTFEGAPYTDTKTITIDPTGHAYTLSGWIWTETTAGYTATAHFICGNDPEHTKDVTATITPAVTAPDCEHGGQTVYTANLSFEGNPYSDTKTVTLDPIGHAYELSGWTWTETADGYKAVAHFVCANDPAHKQEAVATVTSATDDPDCVNGGQTVYTAKVTFEDANYNDKKTVSLDPLRHDLISHAGKAATCTEKGWKPYETCSRCDYTTYSEIPARGHDYISTVTNAPTCTEKGVRTYVCNNDASHTYTEEIDALGHDFGKWVTVKEATAEETGLERRECSRCDAFEERVIPKIKENGTWGKCSCFDKLVEFFKRIMTMLNSMFHGSNKIC